MSRLPMTFERYALIMHMNPCVLHGVTVEECAGMTCADRRLLNGDIRMGVQKMNDALKVYGLALEDREREVSVDHNYWIVDEDTSLREFATRQLADVTVSYSGQDCNKMASIDTGVQLGDCEQFESAEVTAPTGMCGIYPCDWAWSEESPSVISTPAYNLALLDSEGQVSYPEKVSLKIKISLPSSVVAVYERACTCPQSDKPVCGQCDSTTTADACWSLGMDGVMKMRPITCQCNRGHLLGYKFKVIQRGASDDALDDALVSLINYRQAIATCANCNYEAQARLRRDLGLPIDKDNKNAPPGWSLNNGFGIQTAGALAAWNTIILRYGTPGSAGYA